MFARTERLLLRPGWREDAPALFQAICDPRIVRNLAQAPWPYTPDHALSFLTRERGRHDTSCLIFLRSAGAPLLAGGIGLQRLPSGDDELGYWIARPFWGQGIATEAGRAVIAHARHGLRLKRLASGHFVDNPASGRVLAKLGFKPGATAMRYSAGRGGEVPCKLFELDLAAEGCAEGDTCALAA
jgi:RimJ/RimL family protein N-acetyltransferase